MKTADKVLEGQQLYITKLEEQNINLENAMLYERVRANQAEVWYKQPSFIAPLVFVLGVVVGVKAAK